MNRFNQFRTLCGNNAFNVFKTTYGFLACSKNGYSLEIHRKEKWMFIYTGNVCIAG